VNQTTPFDKTALTAISPGAFIYMDTWSWRKANVYAGPSRGEAVRIASFVVRCRKWDVEIDADSVCGPWTARLSRTDYRFFGGLSYKGTFAVAGNPCGGIRIAQSITDAVVRIDFGDDTVSLWRERIRNPDSDYLAIIASCGPVAKRFSIRHGWHGWHDWWHSCFCEKMQTFGRWEFDTPDPAWRNDPKLLSGVLFAFALEKTPLVDIYDHTYDASS
jgi:hypothetical protein